MLTRTGGKLVFGNYASIVNADFHVTDESEQLVQVTQKLRLLVERHLINRGATFSSYISWARKKSQETDLGFPKLPKSLDKIKKWFSKDYAPRDLVQFIEKTLPLYNPSEELASRNQLCLSEKTGQYTHIECLMFIMEEKNIRPALLVSFAMRHTPDDNIFTVPCSETIEDWMSSEPGTLVCMTEFQTIMRAAQAFPATNLIPTIQPRGMP